MPATDSLSGEQFGGLPRPHSREDNIASRNDETPLPESGGTMGSAKSRAAWRTQGVMPYSKATAGSTFNPYA